MIFLRTTVRIANVSVLHVPDYITKCYLSTLYQHRKWNWWWLRLGEAAGMISKGKNRPTRMNGSRSQVLLPGDAGLWGSKWWLLSAALSAVQMIHCRMPWSFLMMNWEDEDLSGLLSQNLLQTQRNTTGIETRYCQLHIYTPDYTWVLSIWRNVQGSIHWRPFRNTRWVSSGPSPSQYALTLHRSQWKRWKAHCSLRHHELWDLGFRSRKGHVYCICRAYLLVCYLA
jgi:hypothetical protein